MNTIAPPITDRSLSVPKAQGPIDWDNPPAVPAIVAIDQFMARGSAHQPKTTARVLHTDDAIHVRFDVEDQYVVVRHDQPNDPVCKDSCVEFFIQPREGQAYFNFELNAGGALWNSYGEQVEALTKVFPDNGVWPGGLTVRTSHQGLIEPEITEPVSWWAEMTIPLEVFAPAYPDLGPLAGQTWRGNFYKCADGCSMPHWGMWSAILEGSSFHQPQYYAPIRFEA